MLVATGATSVSCDVFYADDLGAAVTGKVAADFPACKWSGGSNIASTTITLSDLSLITTAHPNNNTAGGIKEREGGWYRLDLPNNMFTSAGRKTLTFAETTNKRILAPTFDVQNVSVDPTSVQSAIGLASANLDTQLAAIDADVLTRLATSGYTAPLSAAGTRTALGMASANLDSQLSAIASATGAGTLATKVADSHAVVTGTVISGTVSNTETDDDVYLVTAPVTPAVGGFGLRQRFEFDLPLGRTPVSISIRGWWNGTGRVDVYALHSSTGNYDQLTNSTTGLLNRTNELGYVIPLPRDYGDSSGGAANVVTLECRATSTNTANRLRIDQILIAHVAEDSTPVFPTAQDIWSYPERALTSPGIEPVTPPTAAENAAAVWVNSTRELTFYDDSTGVTALPGRLTSARAGYLDNLDVGGDVASQADVSAVGADTPGTTDLLSRLTSARAGYLDNLNVGGDVASSAELAVVDDHVLSRLADSAYIAPMDAGDVRSALGLATNDLDTQLSGIAADAAVILDDTHTTGVKVLSSDKTGFALSSAGLDAIVVDTFPLLEVVGITAGVLAGKVSGAGTGVESFMRLDGVTPAATFTVDTLGNRSAVSYGP